MHLDVRALKVLIVQTLLKSPVSSETQGKLLTVSLYLKKKLQISSAQWQISMSIPKGKNTIIEREIRPKQVKIQ